MARNDHQAGTSIRGGRPLGAGMRSGTWSGTWLCGMVSVVLGLGAGGACLAQETPVAIIAAQIRQQGFTCEEPRRAERDVQASRPNEVVWMLICENTTYRVTLIPNMAARVEVRK